MKRITDKDFVYVPSHDTDIRKTFARVRKEMQKQREAKASRGILAPPTAEAFEEVRNEVSRFVRLVTAKP